MQLQAKVFRLEKYEYEVYKSGTDEYIKLVFSVFVDAFSLKNVASLKNGTKTLQKSHQYRTNTIQKIKALL